MFVFTTAMMSSSYASLVGDQVSYTLGYNDGRIYSSGSAFVDASTYEFTPISSLKDFRIDIDENSIDLFYGGVTGSLQFGLDYLRIYGLDWNASGSVFLKGINVGSSGVANFDPTAVTFGSNEVLIALRDSYWSGGGGHINIELQTTVVPIPASIYLFSTGLIGLIGFARSKYYL